MAPERIAALTVLGLRVAYGAALLVKPEAVTKQWLGPLRQAGPTQVALRGLGAREVGLHTGAIAAVLSGAPTKPWLAASIAGDLSDVAATASADGLPDGAAWKTAVVAGGSAALTALVALKLEG